jgi:peptide/nickel transport system substrate-binding protein
MACSALLVATAGQAAPFRYVEDRAPAIVDPLFTTTMGEARLNELLFDGLFTDDRQLATAPSLAKSIQVSDDRTSADIALRTDVRWHDGTPFTSADVVFTIRAMKDPKTLSPEGARVSWVDSVEATGPHRVRMTFTGPQPSPEDRLHFKILPAHLFSGTVVRRDDAFHTRPVGTGPFRFERFETDHSIKLSVSEGGSRPSTSITEVVMREVSDKSYQAKLILYESVEALVRVLPRDLAILQADRNVELYPYQTNSWWYVGFNLKAAPWDEAEVREALSLLVDTRALLSPVGTGSPVSGPYVPSSPYYNHNVPVVSRDLGRAAELLEGAGYRREGGTWSRNGKPLTVSIVSPRGLESAQEVAINLQSMLQSVGLKVANPRFVDEAEWKRRVWRDQEFELVLSQWSFDRTEDIRQQFHSEGSRNFGSYSNPEVDRLLDEARDTLDPQAKKTALRQVHQLVANDNPMVFLWTLDSYSAVRSSVRKVAIHPFYFFTWITDWVVGSG